MYTHTPQPFSRLLALVMALGMMSFMAQGQKAPAPSAAAGGPPQPPCSAAPAATADLPTICQGGVAVLSFTPACTATTTYACTWTPATNSYPLNDAQVAVNPLVTTTYTCTATPPSGPALTLKVIVKVVANCCMTSSVPTIVQLDDEYGRITTATSPQCPLGCYVYKPDPFVNHPPGTYFQVASGNSLRLVDWDFVMPPGCVLLMGPGKDVLIDDATLDMQGATITAECDQMWGTLRLPADSHGLQTGPAKKGTMRSRIMHSQGGITVERVGGSAGALPATQGQSYFRLTQTDFLHNYVSLSLDQSANAAGSTDLLTNCAFDSDPDAMKGPYAASGPNRTYTYSHLRVAGNLASAPISGNSFDHAVFHVLLKTLSNNGTAGPPLPPYLTLDQCKFANFYVAGIFHDDSVPGAPDFSRPLTVTNSTFTFFPEPTAPKTPQIAAARSGVPGSMLRPGVAGISSTFVPVTVRGSLFVQPDTGPYASFDYAHYRTEQSGIDAYWLRDVKPLNAASLPNQFRGLHYGIRYGLPANDMGAELKGNLFAECEKGVDFVNAIGSTAPANVSTAGTAWLDCNTFTRGVAPATRPGTSYGIYVENGAAARIDNPATSPANTTFLRNLFDVTGLTTNDFVALRNDYAPFNLIYYTYNDYQPVYAPFVVGNVSVNTASVLNPVNSNPYQECAPSYNGVGIPRPAGATGRAIDKATLEQNTPNPVEGKTTFAYRVSTGAQAAELVIRRATDGKIFEHFSLNIKSTALEADLHACPAGVYFYTLLTDGVPVSTRRLIVR